jgi:hypothetical protein
MIIKTDMKEKLYKVTYKLTPKATILRDTAVKAHDKEHAERIAKKLFEPRGRVISVEAVEGRFKRFKEFNR